MSISELPFPIIYKIYDFLEVKDQSNFARTDRKAYGSFSFLRENDARYKKVAEYILENYDIIAISFLTHDLKYFLTSYPSIIGFGENHARDEHRLLNASVINKIWGAHMHLHLEGGKKTLEQMKDLQIGQLKYTNSEIAQTADLWDIDNQETEEFFHTCITYAQTMVTVARQLIHARVLSPKKFSRFLKNSYDKSVLEQIYNRVPIIKKLEHSYENASSIKKQKIMSAIYSGMIDFTLEHFKSYEICMFNKLRALNLRRNLCLGNRFLKTAEQSQTNTFIAGTTHFRDPAIMSIMKKIKAFHSTPFLLLEPKKSLTAESIAESHGKIFDEELLYECSTDENNKNKEIIEFDHFIKHLPIGSASCKMIEDKFDIPKLYDYLFTCDIQALDADNNHFGLWIALSASLLIYEKIKSHHQFAKTS